MNMGLLTPREVVEKAMDFSERNNVPINSNRGVYKAGDWMEGVHSWSL